MIKRNEDDVNSLFLWKLIFAPKLKSTVLVLLSVTLDEGDPKAPFSIATTPRGREGRYWIPMIAPLFPWPVAYNAECWASSTIFESFVWLDLGLKPGPPDHWQTLYSFGQWPVGVGIGINSNVAFSRSLIRNESGKINQRKWKYSEIKKQNVFSGWFIWRNIC